MCGKFLFFVEVFCRRATPFPSAIKYKKCAKLLKLTVLQVEIIKKMEIFYHGTLFCFFVVVFFGWFFFKLLYFALVRDIIFFQLKKIL